MGECFACEGPAGDRFTMVLESRRTFDGVVICEGCRGAYEEVDWIDIRESSTGGSREQEAASTGTT